MDLQKPIRVAYELMHECGNLLVHLGKKSFDYATHPSQFRAQMEIWSQQRQDRTQQNRLNRQVRSQFAEAFNRSAKKDMTVGLHAALCRYKRRNIFFTACLRPYEAFSSLSFPLKIATAVGFSSSLRYLLWPVIGVWGIAAPIAAFIVSRMGTIYKNSENRRQEEDFAKLGLVIPCTFTVAAQKTTVTGRLMDDGFMIGFPVMHSQTPEWITSTYNNTLKKLDNRTLTHAAEFEACRSATVTDAQACSIRKIFAEDASGKNCAFIFSILFPEKTACQIVSDVQQLAAETAKMPSPEFGISLSEKFALHSGTGSARKRNKSVPMPVAVVKALEPFCLRGPEDSGLSVFSGSICMDDIRFLVELQTLGLSPDAGQVQDIVRMTKDARYSGELPLQKIVEVGLWPKDRAAVFDDLWKDREYRTRFGFDILKDMAFNIEGWGGVAVSLARHSYTQALDSAELIELALPENEHWAKAYHKLRISMSDAAHTVSHSDFKTSVQEFGLAAGEKIYARAASQTASLTCSPSLGSSLINF